MNGHMRTLLVRSAIGVLIAFGSVSLLSAQGTVYAAKFVCGYQTGDVPLLSDNNPFPHQYEALKPGNYATTVNILNAASAANFPGGLHNVLVQVSMEGLPTSPTVAPLMIPQFGTRSIDCTDIIPAISPFLPSAPQGEVFEGFLLIFPILQVLEVQAVYTYSSKDEFREHNLFGTDLLSGELVSEDKLTGRRLSSVGGTGAGGLGLGASIDVERVLPRVFP